MREINYYCDICGKKVINPKAEMTCVQFNMAYTHNWETSLPLAKNLQDIQMCKECGEYLNNIINNAKERKGFTLV